MLLKIGEFLNKNSIGTPNGLDVGIVPFNEVITNFNKLNIVFDDADKPVPKMDICFVDNTIPKDIIENIREKTEILVSLGSCISFKADLILPGISVSDDFLNNVVTAFIEDDLEYLKPLLAMSEENDFRTKTIAVTLDNELCVGCSGCAFICPNEAIEMKNTRPVMDFDSCVHCGCCFVICPKSWNLNEEVEAWC